MKFQKRHAVSFVVLVMVLATISTAQTTLSGFLNIPFGTKMETAKKLMLLKSGVKFIRQDDRNDLAFTGLSVGAYKVDTCILKESQVKGMFESGTLLFYSQIDMLQEFYELLCSQYGNPSRASSGKNDRFYQWEFPVKGSKYKNSVTLQNVPAENYFMVRYNGMGMLCPGWLEHCSQKAKNIGEG